MHPSSTAVASISPSLTLLLTIVYTAVLAPAVTAQTCVGSIAGDPYADCTTPLVIPGDVGQHVRYVDVSGLPGGLSPSCGQPTGRKVWFEIVPEASGPLAISTCHPATTYDTVLEVWSGGDPQCGLMTLVDCSDDVQTQSCDNGCSFYGSIVSFDAVAGTRYRFSVAAFEDNVAGCTLCLGLIVTVGEPCGAPPVNLDCSLAETLPATPGMHELLYDVRDAFKLPGEPNPTCTVPDVGHTVWFELTSPSDLNVAFSTCHPATTYDTVIQVYRGDCAGLLAYVECNDDELIPACETPCLPFPRASTVRFEAAANQTYYFQVGSYNDNSAGCEDLCLGIQMDLSEVTAVDDARQEAVAPPPLLGTVRPNPATGRMSVRLELDQPDHVTVDVVDVTGRVQTVLADRLMPAGGQVLTWDGRDARGRRVGQGIYWIRLETRDGKRSTRRVVIVR
ncbi:MAG: T9SS type A sorting domain-containing protein [Candidatus Eiseniibacteriota bacterium]|jgi:hypothetical protein